jgi:hypothetical protein
MSNAAGEVTPKFVSRSDPEAQWTGAMRGPAFFAYSDNNLIDVKSGIIMDIEASRAIRQAEVSAELLSGSTVDHRRVHQQHGKEHEQVKNRKRKQAGSRALFGVIASAQLHCKQYHRRAGHACSRAVDCSSKSECAGQDRNRHQQDAVNENLPLCFGGTSHNRQHWDAGTGVFASTTERQRPEMRGRPQEDDQEENERFHPNAAGGRNPTSITGGKAPAAPPMTIFCGVWRFSHIV